MQTRAGILEKSILTQPIYAWWYLILGEGAGKRGRETKKTRENKEGRRIWRKELKDNRQL